MFRVADLGLSEVGVREIEWAEKHMPVLMRIRSEFLREKPL
ncbi:MAG: adenosylhomocysteinase, partial [Zestosphaera sp.]